MTTMIMLALSRAFIELFISIYVALLFIRFKFIFMSSYLWNFLYRLRNNNEISPW